MSALAIIIDAGVQASIEPAGGLKLKGLSKLNIKQKKQIINYARNHKPAILAELTKNSAHGACESCPAAGYWDSGQYAGQGLLCFHYAYFMGKSGKPNPCSEMSAKCPRKENKNDQRHEFQSV
jgi:hypothetical protein